MGYGPEALTAVEFERKWRQAWRSYRRHRPTDRTQGLQVRVLLGSLACQLLVIASHEGSIAARERKKCGRHMPRPDMSENVSKDDESNIGE